MEASRPEVLEGATLEDGLADVAERWSALNGVPVEFVTTGDPMPLHPEIEVTLLRTAQEALANVAKHAGATRAWHDAVVHGRRGRPRRARRRDRLRGAGCVRRSDVRGFGLTAMRQRVGRVAGTLAVESEPGVGTAISARVPAIGVPPASPGA